MNLKEVVKHVHFEVRKRQYDALKKKRLGVFHVSDYVNECMRNAYYSKMKSGERGGMDSNVMSIFFAGEAVHQLLDSAANGKWGETPVAWNFVDDCSVDVMNDPPKGIEEWMKILIGEYDASMMVGDDQIIMDWKTWKSKGWKRRAADDKHIEQVNYYAYLVNKNAGENRVKYGTVTYFDFEDRLQKPLTFAFKISKMEEIEEKLMLKYQEFKLAYETGALPERTYGWRCDGYCQYVERCAREENIGEEAKNLVCIV